MFDTDRLNRDLLALAMLATIVFAGLSLVSYDPADPPSNAVFPVREQAVNFCGNVGAYFSHAMRSTFGLGAYVILAALVAVDIRLFSRQQASSISTILAGWLLVIGGTCIGGQLLAPGIAQGQIVGSGGYVGAWGIVLLESQFQTAGIVMITAASLIAGLLITADLTVLHYAFAVVLSPIRLFNRVAFGAKRVENPTNDIPVRSGSQRKAALPEPEPEPDDELDEELSDETEASEQEASPVRKPIKVNPPVGANSARDDIYHQLEAKSLEGAPQEYALPDIEMLELPEEFPFELLAKKARVAAEVLEETFQHFGLNIRVVEIDTGPVITQFELELEPGLRLSKVTALADDLAIALRVPSVRVVTSIPGKNTVGVEVPNDKQVMVRLRELIESCPEEVKKKRIPLFIGKDVSGHPMVVDLTKMPHLLIAGRTGTGKSVCLNTLIVSMLMTRSPEDVRMLMIDPKMVELSPYQRIPHLMHPVITDMKKAEAVLGWAVDKMEERYDLLARCGVRHLDGYNKLGKEEVLNRIGIDEDSEEADAIPEKMPYIVIVADEMADMMMTSGKDVEGHIIRLAQKSRAVGIHLVLATQKPTVDVITGLIKSNLPARISFQVASKSDSRVVLDEGGADKLLGNGDMLYLAPGTSNVVRAQGTFVGDDEVNGIIEFFGDHEPQYSTELAQLSSSSSSGGGDPQAMRNRDDLYDQAIEVVIREGRGSVSLLQRCLGIGYGRAARLVDYMAEDGIVGDYNGSQAREVLYTMEQWEEIRDAADAELLEV